MSAYAYMGPASLDDCRDACEIVRHAVKAEWSDLASQFERGQGRRPQRSDVTHNGMGLEKVPGFVAVFSKMLDGVATEDDVKSLAFRVILEACQSRSDGVTLMAYGIKLASWKLVDVDGGIDLVEGVHESQGS